MEATSTQIAAGHVGRLADHGLRHAVISPGSRNTPLVRAVNADARVSTTLVHDERSAGFVALGIGASSGVPAAVITTSGTAAAELLPAVTEADAAEVPLVAITADRPAALRGTGAPQTIDQVALYGGRVRFFADAGPGTADASRAWAAATASPRGPVHINMPLAEPLVGESPAPNPQPLEPPAEGEHPGADLLAAEVAGRRCLLVAGPGHDHALGSAMLALAERLQAPVIADPASGMRRSHHQVIASGHVLAAAGFLEAHPPEVVIRVGRYPTSKPLFQALARLDVPQFGIWPHLPADPDRVCTVISADPAVLCSTIEAGGGPGDWLERWQRADERAGAEAAAVISELGFPSELAVAAAVARAAPPGALWAASSLPIRHLDVAAPQSAARIHANRGANGVDGVISTALGAALGGPATVLVGDVAALHDLNALATAARLGLDVVIVVINNDGGGIFELLPQRELPEFETLFAAPHGVRLAAVADAVGLEAVQAHSAAELEAAVATRPGPRLVEVVVDRSRLRGDMAALNEAAAVLRRET